MSGPDLAASAPRRQPNGRTEPRLPRVLGGQRRWIMTGLLAIGLGQAGAAVATALLVERSYEHLIGAAGAPTGASLIVLGACLVAAVAVGAVLRSVERGQAERLGQEYVHQVRLAMYDRLVTVAPRSLQQRSQGAVALRFVGDVTALRQWVSLGLARIAVGGTVLVGALGAVALLSPVLAAGIAMVVLSGAGTILVRGRKLTQAARTVRRSRSRVAANIAQQVSGIVTVQAFGQSGRERRRLGRQGRRLRDASVARARVAGSMQGMAEATAGLATTVVLILGASEIGAGRITPSAIVAALAIVGMMVAPIRDLGRSWEYRQNAQVARARLMEFLVTPSLVDASSGAHGLAPGPGSVELRNVSVAGSLSDISVVLKPGTSVAIVGPNGAGKSTLLHLVARLIDPDAGQVMIDGQDLREVSVESVHRSVAMAGADVPLLRGSILRNLLYRQPDASPEACEHVWKLCGVDTLLDTLPEGAATRIADDGRGLSSGQRARIALARALLGDSRILLLDEADANFDPQMAQAVDRVIQQYSGTILLVTHRRDRLRTMDAVWHLEGGRLMAAGPPSDVLAPYGPTHRLFAHAPETWTDPAVSA